MKEGSGGTGARLLLVCGILSPLLYAGTDILAGSTYPGYSFASQAVSELFAIGAPTSGLVVPLFSIGSLLLLAFALGVWRVGRERRAVKAMAVMFAASAVNGLVLWICFPMHMRGAERTFTDTMHLALAANPFVPLSLILGAVAFKQWFRVYSVSTIVVMIALASVAFSYAPQLHANEPTPWLGLTERISQWTYGVWQIVLAAVLLRADLPRLTPQAARAILLSRSGRTRVRAKD